MESENSEITPVQQQVFGEKPVTGSVDRHKVAEEFDRRVLFGKGLLKVVTEREAKRYTPFTDSRRIPKDYLDGLYHTPPTGNPLTEGDVEKVKQSSFGISLELAAQIIEYRSAGGGQLREEGDNLAAFVNMMRKGGILKDELIKKDRQLVTNEARKVIARRSQKPSEGVRLSDQQLISWTDEQFQKANGRLSEYQRRIEAYLNVRW